MGHLALYQCKTNKDKENKQSLFYDCTQITVCVCLFFFFFHLATPSPPEPMHVPVHGRQLRDIYMSDKVSG